MSAFDRLCDRLAALPAFPALIMCLCLGVMAVVGLFERVPS